MTKYMTWSEYQCDEDWTGLTRIFHVTFVNRDSWPMAWSAVRWLRGWFICSNSRVWVSWRLDWDPFWVQPFIILFFSMLINSARSLASFWVGVLHMPRYISLLSHPLSLASFAFLSFLARLFLVLHVQHRYYWPPSREHPWTCGQGTNSWIRFLLSHSTLRSTL